METMNPTKEEIKLLIDNALLQNNERINSTIQLSADKVSATVKETTDAYIGQITTLANSQGTLNAEVAELKSKVNNLWAKMISVGATCATLGAFFVILWSSK